MFACDLTIHCMLITCILDFGLITFSNVNMFLIKATCSELIFIFIVCVHTTFISLFLFFICSSNSILYVWCKYRYMWVLLNYFISLYFARMICENNITHTTIYKKKKNIFYVCTCGAMYTKSNYLSFEFEHYIN